MRAVAFAQTDMTTFILSTVLREAQAVIEEHERIRLSARQPPGYGADRESPCAQRETPQSRPRHAGAIVSLARYYLALVSADTSQSLTVPSRLPLASNLPAGLKATARTVSEWPSSVARSLQVSESQIFTVLS